MVFSSPLPGHHIAPPFPRKISLFQIFIFPSSGSVESQVFQDRASGPFGSNISFSQSFQITLFFPPTREQQDGALAFSAFHDMFGVPSLPFLSFPREGPLFLVFLAVFSLSLFKTLDHGLKSLITPFNWTKTGLFSSREEIPPSPPPRQENKVLMEPSDLFFSR